jgi:TadE-like protein
MAILKEGRRPARSSGHARQSGQSLVEFGVSSIVLLLLLGGVLDLSRVFYFDTGIHGAAWAGARHGAWYDFGQKQNTALDDADITTAVNQGLTGAGLPSVSGPRGTCPTGQGNSLNNPPYDSSYYPTAANTAYLYLCYTKPGVSTPYGTEPTAPLAGDTSWRGGDINVIVLLNYGLITSFMQAVLNAAGGIHVATNAHFVIQGGY